MDERSEENEDVNLPERIMAGNAEEVVREISEEKPVFEDKKEIQKSPDLHDESNLVYIPKHVPDDNKEWYANENSEPCIPIILFNTFWTFISL